MGIKFKVLGDDRVHGVLLNALHTAARYYDGRAESIMAGILTVTTDYHRSCVKMSEQFKKQAADARELADEIEQAITVNLAIEA